MPRAANSARPPSSIAAAVLSTCAMALASSTSQRVPGGSSSAMARSRALTWSALKNSRLPWIRQMREPGHRARLRRAVQLVEAVAAGDAAEHRVAREHHLVQQVDEGRADRDDHAVQDAEADRPRHARSARRRTPSG